MDDMIPRDKVEQIVRNIRELQELNKRKARTQARLIRWCVAALTQTTTQAQRRLEAERMREVQAGKRYRNIGPHEPTAKVREDKDMALLQLQWLATKLEDEGADIDLSEAPTTVFIA